VDTVSEDVIIQWYKTDHISKGKSVFLGQMEKMVDWLQNAEEESSEDEDEDEDWIIDNENRTEKNDSFLYCIFYHQNVD